MPFGVTPEGFVPKRQEHIEADLRAGFAVAPSLGANINTDPESPAGQVIVLVAAALAEPWAALEQVYNSQDLLSAADDGLDRLLQRYRLERFQEDRSRVTVTLQGTPGTQIQAGAAITLEDAGSRWVLTANAEIGVGTAVFEAEDVGPLQALADSTWEIATPVGGWTGVTNATDAVVGRFRESNASARTRAMQAAASGSRAEGAIRAAVLRVPNVSEAIVIENDTAFTDADGRPLKSFEVVVRGGADEAVAAAIWATKPTGIQVVSTVDVANQVSETVVDRNGDPQTVVFGRPDVVPAYLEVDYLPRGGVYPANGEALMLAGILDFEATLRIGGGVSPADITQALLRALPHRALRRLEIRLGTQASPRHAAEIPTSRTQLADFDSSRVTFTRLP